MLMYRMNCGNGFILMITTWMYERLPIEEQAKCTPTRFPEF